MLLIIVLGFIIPWLTAPYVYKLAPKIFYTVAPVGALIAVTLNQLGIHLGLWKVHHMPTVVLLDSIFLDFGIFTVVSVWFIFILYYKQKNPLWVYPAFIFGMTGIESIALAIETVSYDEEWNLFYTLLMYIGGFTTLHILTRKLVTLKIYP
ncbi:hypothetical protein [Halobacillus mangrovi]|uniref:Uncharacterized protein n=1 Tax=Halobacillus mangrovi TaxID=402384 RepID=A0A1W5ZZ54_9BACI|nr:hypothetical protein [Halobacillus mangrovi]ARI78625.1 hypothetical protein HM131_18040 [Halobacillus mangrovi]